METSFISTSLKAKSNAICGDDPSLVDGKDNQRQPLITMLNNLIYLKMAEKALKKQQKKEEKRRKKERTSSSSTMVVQETTPLSSRPPLHTPSAHYPKNLDKMSKSKGMVVKSTNKKSAQQRLLEKNEKALAQLEAVTAVKGSSMLTAYSMVSLFLSSSSESISFTSEDFSNERIHVDPRSHRLPTSSRGPRSVKETSMMRSMVKEDLSKSTLFSGSNASMSSSSTASSTSSVIQESSFVTGTILTETNQSQPYSLVTSYLSSLSPMAEAEISSSFYSEMEDLFQLVKTKLEASSTLTTIESDYYSYADIVYHLGLCYHDLAPITMVKLLYQAAVRGHAKAQYLLGRHFLLGQVIPYSLKFGVYWLTHSANQGHEDALYDLGCLYLSDYSPQYHNVEQGKSYLQFALDHGNLKAEKILNQLKKD